MLVYKILRAEEWQKLQQNGSSQGAPVDEADEFVHFSTGEQLAETAAKHFAGEDGLTLLAFEAAQFGPDLRWEVSRGGALFPHLYRELRLDEVLWHRPITLQNGQHLLGDTP